MTHSEKRSGRKKAFQGRQKKSVRYKGGSATGAKRYSRGLAKGSKASVLLPPYKVEESLRGFHLVARFLEPTGRLDLVSVGRSFGLSKAQLAETVGVSPATLQRKERAHARKTQDRVREMVEIVARIADWAGGEQQALAWYKAEPIPAFGGRTAESLVKEGKATAVRDYLDHIALGGFA